MAKCPNCGVKQPFRKYLLLTNNGTFNCIGCGEKLGANRSINMLIGGIGGGVGALIGVFASRVGFEPIAVGLIVLWLSTTIAAQRFLTRLEAR